MTVLELFKEEQKYWKKKNIDLLGLNPIDEKNKFVEIQKSIDKSCEKYWNVDKPCELAVLLNDGTLDHDAKLKVKNSYRLQLNPLNMCVDVFAMYKVHDEEKEFKVCSLPTPDKNLTWIINRIHYTPRITAAVDHRTIVSKHHSQPLIIGEEWTYNLDDKTFRCSRRKNPFEPTLDVIFDEHLSERSRALLTATLGKKLTKENFVEALENLPEFKYNSIFNYKFSRFEYFEDLVLNSKRYATPTKNIMLGVNTTFVSQAKQYTTSGEKLDGQLILSTSPIFSLENFRTVVNIYRSENSFTPTFYYEDSIGFFDSFKTATSKSAGRQRLVLDNISIKNGMLWIREKDGSEHNMFEYIGKPQDSRISCLSYSPFCHNNQSKRIMMTAKLSSQAVPLKGEKDEITHRIPARVIFADIEGYTSADSIVISKSFAKKLTTYQDDIIYVTKNDNIYKVCKKCMDEKGGNLSMDELKLLYPTKSNAILDNFDKARITDIDELEDNKNVRLFISYEIPFGLGDKISNLHGAKGTVGYILPDEEMPQLTKEVGIMEPGPLDIVISGFSTIRRGSLGQLFEAWANASGITYDEGEDFIATMVDKYGNQMKKFSQNSIIEYNGKKSVRPIGIIDMIRVYHHASVHISESSVNSSFNKMLKLGEMEKLNLLSSDSTHILEELAIRSMQKYASPHRLIAEMQETRKLPENPRLRLRFAQLMKAIGYDIKLDRNSLVQSDMTVINYKKEDLRSQYDNKLKELTDKLNNKKISQKVYENRKAKVDADYQKALKDLEVYDADLESMNAYEVNV